MYGGEVSAYLGILAIVISNTLEAMDTTAPNNGFNLQTVWSGVTKDTGIGVAMQFLLVTSWYTVVVSQLSTIFGLLSSIVNNETANPITPTIVYLVGLALYHTGVCLEDISYWFNLFETNANIRSYDGAWMFVASEVPTCVFVVYLSRLIIKVVGFSNAAWPISITRAAA